jgi:hypothetical protein
MHPSTNENNLIYQRAWILRDYMGMYGAPELEWERSETFGAVVGLSSSSQLGTHW